MPTYCGNWDDGVWVTNEMSEYLTNIGGGMGGKEVLLPEDESNAYNYLESKGLDEDKIEELLDDFRATDVDLEAVSMLDSKGETVVVDPRDVKAMEDAEQTNL